MKNQTFLGVFLIIIGALGLIVGLITGHFMDSPGRPCCTSCRSSSAS